MKFHLLIILSIGLAGCSVLDPFSLWSGDDDDDDDQVENISGEPSAGSQEIYESSDLTDLCVDNDLCNPPYDKLAGDFLKTDGQEPLVAGSCNFDYDPNLSSRFVLNRVDGSVNGLNLLLSKEDLFFIAWVSIRHQINPHFLLGVMVAESTGNCAAVSGSAAEGCFQITNTFGQAQLDQSYPDRVSSWFWTDRSGSYYPDDIFVEPSSYFGEIPSSDQFRLTLDPTAASIDGVEVSSVVNFPFGIIASGLYYRWQHYLLYYNFRELRGEARELFQEENGKALWQAAAYNGGAWGAANALEDGGLGFLDFMGTEPQRYAPTVVDYCTEFQAGTSAYTATYTVDDLGWIIDLLSFTYPSDSGVDWKAVKDEITQVFFSEEVTELTFTDDIKALIYVISTHTPELAPEWPIEDSIR